MSYKNPAAKLLPTTFVLFLHPGQTVEQRDAYFLWQRALERGWTTRTMVSDHNAQDSHPRELVALLEDAPRDRNKPKPGFGTHQETRMTDILVLEVNPLSGPVSMKSKKARSSPEHSASARRINSTPAFSAD